MRKNRESAAAKASLAGLAPAASNAPLGCHQTSSTASISAYTSASNPACQNGNHNGSQNGGRIALNSSSQLQINGNDKASIGTNKPTNNLNSSNNSNNSSYGHSTHNNNTTTITSIPVKAVTPGIASRTRATPAVQTTRNNCSSSPTRYRVDEGTEEIEIEDRDRDRDRERHMGGSNGVRIQSNNNNQNSNHNDSQNETPNEHKNQNQNQNYNSNQSGRVRSEHRQVAGSPSMGDVSARLLSIEMKLDKILKHLGI